LTAILYEFVNSILRNTTGIALLKFHSHVVETCSWVDYFIKLCLMVICVFLILLPTYSTQHWFYWSQKHHHVMQFWLIKKWII